jgi:diadenosine tetraphosphate (Ap4A) HIT family hydrolase
VRFSKLAGILALALLLRGDVRDCACDISKPDTMAAKNCGLCREAEKQPVDTAVFFLKDINPLKPNRWLALPRAHTHALKDLSPEARLALWNAAIEKARSMWGDQWGLAVNGDERRSQCHAHIHIGKLLNDVETPNFVVVDGPADILIPTDGAGFWVHPVGGKLHVHSGEQATEIVLMR